MPGPKMGPRPADFCEDLVRQSPTFAKWEALQKGEKLRYACRDFIKGHDQDEERLMRRIMIARRNNLRDHAILKRARIKQDDPDSDPVEATEENIPRTTRKRRPASTFSDGQVAKEMDVAAVEATRSYRAWMELPDGAEFVYNQKYYKGRPNQDWLLRKNIWRRMRYRRENKKLVNKLREDDPNISAEQPSASDIVDQALSPLIKQETDISSVPQVTGPAPPDPSAPDPVTEQAGAKRASESEEEEGRAVKVPRTESQELLQSAPAPVFTTVQNHVPAPAAEEAEPIPEEDPTLSIPRPPPPVVLTDDHHTHHHHAPPALSAAASTHDETAHAALTAAAAATASGAADDLVELSAVEAAVAAAADYVQLATHQNDHDDEDDEDHHHHHDLDAHHHPTSVHNPLEAAANAAALDSAAKLAAAATAQEVTQQVADHQENLVLHAEDHNIVTV